MTRRLLPTVLAAALSIPVLAAPALGQHEDFHWDKALAAGNEVSIHNINGDIKVMPSTNGHVTVSGFKHGSSRDTEHLKTEVHESSRGISVCVLYDDADSYCDEDGMHMHSRRGNNRDWNDGRMDLEVSVPANLLVSAGSVSGDIEINGAHGDVEASSVSGDVHMTHLHAAGITAHSVSGDIDVSADELADRGDLHFNTVSGDVTLNLPAGLDADLSMSTVSGDIDSDFPLTLGNGRVSRRGMNARIGKGGRRLDVRTVSGDLRLRSPNGNARRN
ncbi:MAG: DUF4097 family beta strand repeat-containing protein [Gemmatimonadales bacterium]